MEFAKSILAFISTFFQDLRETRQLQQEAQAKQYRQQQCQRAIMAASSHYYLCN